MNDEGKGLFGLTAVAPGGNPKIRPRRTLLYGGST